MNCDTKFAMAFVAGLVITAVFYALHLDFFYQLLRTVLGLIFVLFIPGYIASRALFSNSGAPFGKKEVNALERIGLSVGLSISLVILTIMFSKFFLDIDVNLFSILVQVSSICVFFGCIILFQKNKKCMRSYDRFISRVTFKEDPKRTKKLFIIVGISLITVLLAVDIFFPYLFLGEKTKEPIQKRLLAKTYELPDLYNESMTVHSFYPQKEITQDLMGIAISRPVVANFDDKIAFLGYDIDSTEIPAGHSFHIRYFWKILDKVKSDYDVFVHITDLDGNIKLHQDHEFPNKTSSWEKNSVIMEEYDINIPRSISEGPYIIRIGLYKKRSGARLPILSGRLIDNQNRIIISVIEIGKSIPKPITPIDLSDVYDSSAPVQRFYPQKNITQSLANVEIPNPLVANFGEKILFLGYDLDKTTVKCGKSFHITYFWKSINEIDTDYTALVSITSETISDYTALVSATERLAFKHNHGFPLKTSSWDKEYILMEEYDVTVPENMEEGAYQISIALNNPDTNRNLEITSGTNTDSENRINIGEINIVE